MRPLDFVIIGAAKAGTTSLFSILNEHPRIFMPREKEPEFFARDDLYSQGIDSYHALYEMAGDQQLIGEASTIYSLSPFFPRTAERIYAHSPDARLIYVLRQPVERAYSFYVQLTKNFQNETKDRTIHRSFEEFILPERRRKAAGRHKSFAKFDSHLPDLPELCLAGSEYVLQIETYLEYFERDRILFLKFEDFLRDQKSVARQVTDFLRLQPLNDDVFFDSRMRRNISKAHFDELAADAITVDLRGRLGTAWEMRKLVPKSARQRLRHILGKATASKQFTPLPMETETKRMLEARYAVQMPQLMELTGLNFGDWGLDA